MDWVGRPHLSVSDKKVTSSGDMTQVYIGLGCHRSVSKQITRPEKKIEKMSKKRKWYLAPSPHIVGKQ